jgi:hypothetical protein
VVKYVTLICDHKQPVNVLSSTPTPSATTLPIRNPYSSTFCRQSPLAATNPPCNSRDSWRFPSPGIPSLDSYSISFPRVAMARQLLSSIALSPIRRYPLIQLSRQQSQLLRHAGLQSRSVWQLGKGRPRIFPSVRPSIVLYGALRSSPSPHAALRMITTKVLTEELPKPERPFLRFIYRSFFYFGVFIAFSAAGVVAFFLYDASTYDNTNHLESVPVSSLALNPRRGGPKNLQIVEHFVDDDDCEHKRASKHKPKLVILGTGWGAVSLLKTLNVDEYHITVVSPSNQFLFTPMLPSATVGTLELRSLVEPIRGIVNRVHGHFLKAMAKDVDFSEKLIEVEHVEPDGNNISFYVPYDKLIISCGKWRYLPRRLVYFAHLMQAL